MKLVRTHILLLAIILVSLPFYITPLQQPSKFWENQLLLSDTDSFWPETSYHGNIPVEAEGNDIFYWYFPSRTLPKTDPILIWLTGGPGCSSETALQTENGPFKLPSDNVSIEPYLNLYSWSTSANLVYVDNPIGAGFSMAKFKNLAQDRAQMQKNFYEFLLGFLSKYPDLKGRPLYISGESYAGKYIPYYAEHIQKNGKLNKNESINLQGLIIGNGMVAPHIQDPHLVTFAQNNGIYTKERDSQIREKIAKCDKVLKDKKLRGIDLGETEAAEIPDEIEKYMMELEPCAMIASLIMDKDIEPKKDEDPNGKEKRFNMYDIRLPCIDNKKNCYPWENINKFMNQDKVKKALGQIGRTWQVCDNDVFTMSYKDQLYNSKKHLEYVLNDSIRVLLFYGEFDFIVNWEGGLHMANELEWKYQDEFRKAKVEDVGYGLRKKANNLEFIKFYRAGHMVPMDQPKESLNMLVDFMFNSS